MPTITEDTGRYREVGGDKLIQIGYCQNKKTRRRKKRKQGSMVRV